MPPSFLSFVRLKFGKMGTELQMARLIKSNVRAAVCTTCPVQDRREETGTEDVHGWGPRAEAIPCLTPVPAALEREKRAGEETVMRKTRMVWAASSSFLGQLDICHFGVTGMNLH